MDPKQIEKLFADLGVPTDEPGRLRRAKDLVIHALAGCRPVPLVKYDEATDQMEEVGLICVSCLRQCGYTKDPIQ